MKILFILIFIAMIAVAIYGLSVFLDAIIELKQVIKEKQEMQILLKDYDNLLNSTLDSLTKCHDDRQKLIDMIFPVAK